MQKLGLTQSLQQKLSPQQIQFIKLLQIPTAELDSRIEEELEENPVLEEGKEESELFSDANDGFDYIKGRYSLRNFRLTGKSNELIINQYKEGKFVAPYDTFKIQIHGLPFDIGEIQIDNEPVTLEQLKVNGTHSFVVDKNFSELHIISK